jgi:hypothetical protein
MRGRFSAHPDDTGAIFYDGDAPDGGGGFHGWVGNVDPRFKEWVIELLNRALEADE